MRIFSVCVMIEMVGSDFRKVWARNVGGFVGFLLVVRGWLEVTQQVNREGWHSNRGQSLLASGIHDRATSPPNIHDSNLYTVRTLFLEPCPSADNISKSSWISLFATLASCSVHCLQSRQGRSHTDTAQVESTNFRANSFVAFKSSSILLQSVSPSE